MTFIENKKSSLTHMFVQRRHVPLHSLLSYPQLLLLAQFSRSSRQTLRRLCFHQLFLFWCKSYLTLLCSLLVLTYKSVTLRKVCGHIIGKYIFSKRFRCQFPLNSKTLDTINTNRLPFIKYLIVFINIKKTVILVRRYY